MDSSRKRKTSPALVANPFIKKRNLEWRVSPPPLGDPERRRVRGAEQSQSPERLTAGGIEGAGQDDSSEVVQHSHRNPGVDDAAASSAPPRPISSPSSARAAAASTSARVESAHLQIDNHLAYFTALLATRTLAPYPAAHPRLSIAAYAALYSRSHARPTGAHFVVTQHDHPVAGPHYDLRLQINASSSCSWAIMYGLPGDPNSRGKAGRTGSGVLRNATETRVHCLWNHLVETAGRETGSLLVWDTGEYEVLLPPDHAPSDSDSNSASNPEGSDGGGASGSWVGLTQQQRLARAFASRKIRLKLHGTRLPSTYVMNLRLTSAQDAAGRAKAQAQTGASHGRKKPRRRRRAQAKAMPNPTGPDTSDSSDDDDGGGDGLGEEVYDDGTAGKSGIGLSAMEKELREIEDEEVRRTNAYVGAVNTIGSVHQRTWFLSLEREACGFVRGRREGSVWWERKDEGEETAAEGDENRLRWPFYVRGPEHERSVVTGRLGREVLRDEGVVGYVGRKGWRPILG